MSGILVIGSLNMDMTFYADHFPEVGQTIASRAFMMAPGGKGANQALAASRLGGQVYMAGCVGEDLYADALVDTLNTDGVDTALVRRVASVNTGLACITVCGGANMIMVDAGANARLMPEDIDRMENVFSEVDFVILQFEIPMPTVEHAAKTARRHGCTVIVNPAPYQPISPELLKNIDFLIPNETEAKALLGWDEISPRNAADALNALRAMGVKQPMITLGDKGAAYWDGSQCVVQACCPAKAVDTTAAGDTFIGALVSRLSAGESLTQAVDFAQHASAICVTRKGAHSSIPALREVLAEYAK